MACKQKDMDIFKIFFILIQLFLFEIGYCSSDLLKVPAECKGVFTSSVRVKSLQIPSYEKEIRPWGDVIVDGVPYWHSNRTLDELRQNTYFNGELDLKNIVGKKILDLPAGEGASVSSLLAEGIEAYGVDIAFSSEAPRNNQNLIRANWYKLPFKDEFFDITMMNNGIFMYSHNYEDQHLIKSLAEAIRVTSKSGTILVSGVSEPLRLERIAANLGLQLEKSYPNKDSYSWRPSALTYQFKLQVSTMNKIAP